MPNSTSNANSDRENRTLQLLTTLDSRLFTKPVSPEQKLAMRSYALNRLLEKNKKISDMLDPGFTALWLKDELGTGALTQYRAEKQAEREEAKAMRRAEEEEKKRQWQTIEEEMKRNWQKQQEDIKKYNKLNYLLTQMQEKAKAARQAVIDKQMLDLVKKSPRELLGTYYESAVERPLLSYVPFLGKLAQLQVNQDILRKLVKDLVPQEQTPNISPEDLLGAMESASGVSLPEYEFGQ